MLVRLKLCSVAIIASITITSVTFVVMGDLAPAAAAISAQLIAAIVLLTVRSGRVPVSWSGALVFLEWLMLVVAVQAARSVAGSATAESWMVLLVVGYSVGQLERVWYLAGLATAVAAIGFTTDWRVDTAAPHLITFTSMIGISVLCWFSSGVFVRRLEHLRILDARHATELAEALAETSKALAERESMQAERERVLEQLMLSQRMEAVGRLASGIAHDMNNVLAGVVGMASLIRNDVPPHLHDDLDAIVASGHRGAELTRSLLAFARHERMRDEQFELAKVAEEVLLILRRTQPKTANCELEIIERPSVMGDPTLVTQAVLNLCLNAVDAINSRGNVTVTVSTIALSARQADGYGLPEGRYATVAVRDDGVGIDDETRSRMFEPFFTTKALGEGTGLGLSMVYGTVRAHAGAVHAASELAKGAVFTMLLPALDNVVVDLTGERPLVRRRHVAGRSHVLIVDDDPMVLSVTARLLRVAGFDSIEAVNGAEGLAIFARDRQRIGAVILDMSMPVMGGAECFHRLRDISPDVKVILSTGYAESDQLEACAALSPHCVVEKPFDPFTLIEAVRSAADRTAVTAPSGLVWRGQRQLPPVWPSRADSA